MINNKYRMTRLLTYSYINKNDDNYINDNDNNDDGNDYINNTNSTGLFIFIGLLFFFFLLFFIYNLCMFSIFI